MSTTDLDRSTTPSTTNIPSQSSSSESNAISPAAVTAIAVPVILVVAALIASLCFFFKRYTVSRRPKRRQPDPESPTEGPDVDKWRLNSCAELNGDNGAIEAEGDSRLYEADAGNARCELDGDEPSRIEVPSRRNTPKIPSRAGTMKSTTNTMHSQAGTTRTGRVRAGRSWLSLDLPRI